MKFRINYIPEGSKCDTKRFLDNTATGTIHWIGPYPEQTPDQVRKYWIDSNGEASAHFIIKDDECLQCWPISKAAWHAGGPAGNYSSIGIEVIPENKEGRFSDASIETLRELLDKYFKDLPLVRHYDWSSKDCPKYYVDSNNWTDLLEKLGRG